MLMSIYRTIPCGYPYVIIMEVHYSFSDERSFINDSSYTLNIVWLAFTRRTPIFEEVKVPLSVGHDMDTEADILLSYLVDLQQSFLYLW